MCDFKPGDEVIARKGWPHTALLKAGLIEGRVYEVERVVLGTTKPIPMLVLCGLSDNERFDCRGFRKVQRRSSETGMAILKSICDNPGQLEEDTKQDQVEKAARMVFGPWGDYTDDGTFGLR